MNLINRFGRSAGRLSAEWMRDAREPMVSMDWGTGQQ